MEDYDKIKKTLAVAFMHDLDNNRPEGKMCLSNGECADIEKAFNEQDWPKLARYLDKYTESEDERMMREFNDWLCEEIECLTNDLRDEKDRRTLNILCYVLKKFKDRPEKQKESLHISESCKENADSFTSEQKPEEWSEEDERMLSRCEKSIESSKQFADSDTFKKAKDNEIDWLENRFKSLRPQPHWKKSLATADLENSLCDLQDNYHDGSNEYKVLGEAIEFIRCTEPRPSWKPSEEQMRCLCEVVDEAIRKHNLSIGGYPRAKILESLYKQLQKL